MSTMIKIENLSKSYNGIKVLNHINLTIEEGEFVCILGSSGEGKTTLLNLIGGFIKKDGGKITLKDKEVTHPAKECIMIFQEFDQLFPWKTLRDNIEFPLKNAKRKYTQEEIRKQSSTYINMVKLQGFEEYYPHQLSGGMKQRTSIARSLVTMPKVLLMDEPFGSLDGQTKNQLHKTLLDIWKKTKTTIVFITHDVREALILADRIVIMKNGEISKVVHNQDKSVSENKVQEITSFL